MLDKSLVYAFVIDQNMNENLANKLLIQQLQTEKQMLFTWTS